MFKRFWWVFLMMMPVGIVVGFLVAALVTYLMPRKYESETVIEVRMFSNGEAEESQSPPQHYSSAEFNFFASRSSLEKVIANLELTNRWGVDKEAVLKILKENVTTQRIRNTDLISIKVRHTDPEDARNIAAEVAKVYRDFRKEMMHRDEERNLEELNKAVKDQEERVEERQKVLSTINRSGSLLAGPDKLRTQDFIDAKRDLETDQVLLQKLKLRQIGATTVSKIPSESIVIHEEPQLSNVPVSPKVALNLILGTVIGFLISPLLALPVIVLLNRLNPVRQSQIAHAVPH